VDTVFGYPGGTILNIYDELYRYQDKIRHILTAHEQGASHAADGYARATGKVGVCFATSGPGATNLTTGIATAHMDSSPVVFLTCNVGESTLGKDAFQEVDITGIAMPITKATYLVRDPNEIPDVIREAFAVAAMGRPGPVLIDLLKNVTSLDTMIDYEYLPKEEHQFHGRLAELRKRVGWDLNTPAPNREDVEKLVELIARSERPMLICGGGVVRSRADREFATLAQRLDAPVAITVMGGGGFPGGHALTTGMLGMHGSRASNIGCDNCDLLIAVGCRFSDRVATDPKDFAKQAKIVHIDIDRAEIDKNVRTDHHIIGDAKQVLRMVNERIPSMTTPPGSSSSSPTAPARRPTTASSRPARSSRPSGAWHPATPSYVPTWASIRCGPSSTSTSTTPASSSPPAASAPWASASAPPSAPRWATPRKQCCS